MGGRDGQMSLMDALAIVSFMIGIANYGENVSQESLQETMASAVEEIHSHLELQDKRIERILSLLEGGNPSER